MKAIVFSKKDTAGKNIAKALIQKGFHENGKTFSGSPIYENKDLLLFSIEEEAIFGDSLNDFIMEYNPELLVVASKHKSESGRPTLSVHPTGNYHEAKYGGEPKTLQATNANAMRNVFLYLLNETPKGYELSLEATHHGPTDIRVPLFFAEVGSTEKQWQDLEAADFLAEAILNGLESKEEAEAVIGFGGGHYCPTFTKMESEVAFGHICPKYSVDFIDVALVKQMVEQTTDGVKHAILDEKGLKGRHKTLIKDILDEVGVDY
ncbi:MAG: hypothetical protein J7L23_04035 [Candidatus Diapherotrites archaeon]|nr:hypothetical protein [Candidatus Diapherotrites archaeon]